MEIERKRPTGVTIIGILKIIGGILVLIGGFVLISIGPIISQMNGNDQSSTLVGNQFSDGNDTNTMITNSQLSKVSGYFNIFGIISIPLGIANLIVGVGLLKGKGWAWLGAVILGIISIVFNVVYLAILGGVDAASIGGTVVGIIIDGIILWYLFRPKVKEYFGRVKIQTS